MTKLIMWDVFIEVCAKSFNNTINENEQYRYARFIIEVFSKKLLDETVKV